MKRILSITALSAAALLALTGCTMPFAQLGPVVSEDREIEAVTTVVLDTSGDLTISEGEPSLTIHAPQQVLERLTSDVWGDTLTLGRRGPSFGIGSSHVRYELTVPSLEKLELNGSGSIRSTVSSDGTLVFEIDGSGEIEVTGIDAERVDVRMSGSGEIDLSGTADSLLVELDGSGDIELRDLAVRDAVVEVGGSGDVSVAVSDTLAARIDGSGRIEYSGDPAVESEVSGSGEIVRD